MSNSTKVIYRSYVKDIMKDVYKAEKKRVKAAAKLVATAIKAKLKTKAVSMAGQPPGKQSGRLIKGVAYKIENTDSALVGFKAPAHHAHLLEFGTRQRVRKDGKKSGHVAPRPFFVPTLKEQADNVRKIFMEPWTDYV